MATINGVERSPNRKWIALMTIGILAVVVLVLLILNLRRPPQMGSDDEVFKTVDALFTAVTAHDEKLLSECEQRLHAYRDAGKLPPETSNYLNDIIRRARAGRWEAAAERLYEFMRAQRREHAGCIGEPSPGAPGTAAG